MLQFHCYTTLLTIIFFTNHYIYNLLIQQCINKVFSKKTALFQKYSNINSERVISFPRLDKTHRLQLK